jgi:hypothetical protein
MEGFMRLLTVLFLLLLVFLLVACDEELEVEEFEYGQMAFADAVIEVNAGSDPYLLVLNTSGNPAETAKPQYAGDDLYARMTRRSITEPAVTAPVRKMLKDLPFTGKRTVRKTSGAPAVPRPQFKLTHETATHTFNAFDAAENPIQIAATRVYGAADSRCLIFKETTYSGFSDWATLGAQFDNDIYTGCTNIFGAPTDVDENGKIVILYYNMDRSGESSGILGYFYPVDLYDPSTGAQFTDSNEMEVFYMNTGFGSPDEGDMIRTLAHEFQHMINYGQRVMENSLPRMDTWIDEGLAEGSEHYVMATPGASRLAVMQQDADGKIRNGKSLCVWGNDDESYSLSYTFMQYCRLQAADWRVFTSVINHANGDYQGVSAVMKANNAEFNDFNALLRGYRLANLVKASSGLYGYGAENDDFSAITAREPTLSPKGIRAGGCLYVPMEAATLDEFSTSRFGNDIRFVKVKP